MLKITGNRVLVDPIKETEMTESNLQLVRSRTAAPEKGKVVAIGSGYAGADGIKRPPRLEEGEIILFNSMAGQKLTVEGRDFLLLEENQILAKVKS